LESDCGGVEGLAGSDEYCREAKNSMIEKVLDFS
jgi:hypothetical protein